MALMYTRLCTNAYSKIHTQNQTISWKHMTHPNYTRSLCSTLVVLVFIFETFPYWFHLITCQTIEFCLKVFCSQSFPTNGSCCKCSLTYLVLIITNRLISTKFCFAKFSPSHNHSFNCGLSWFSLPARKLLRRHNRA